jgi:hypothetical protein
VLADLRAVIASGTLVHSSTADACKWCHYQYACRSGAHDDAKRKAGAAELAAYRSLAAHE